MLRPDARVSVIIPHLDDLAGLGVCITPASMLKHCRATASRSSSPTTAPRRARRIEAAAPGARVVRITERGAGPARNGGVAVSLHEVLAFTDSDCLPEPQWLEGGLRVLSADLVGGGVTVSVADPAQADAGRSLRVRFRLRQPQLCREEGLLGHRQSLHDARRVRRRRRLPRQVFPRTSTGAIARARPASASPMPPTPWSGIPGAARGTNCAGVAAPDERSPGARSRQGYERRPHRFSCHSDRAIAGCRCWPRARPRSLRPIGQARRARRAVPSPAAARLVTPADKPGGSPYPERLGFSARRKSWARLIRCVYEVDLLLCPC